MAIFVYDFFKRYNFLCPSLSSLQLINLAIQRDFFKRYEKINKKVCMYFSDYIVPGMNGHIKFIDY